MSGTFTLTGKILHHDKVTPVVNAKVKIYASPYPDMADSALYTQGISVVTDANGQFSQVLLTETSLYYQVSSVASNGLLVKHTPPLFDPITFAAPAAGTTVDISALTSFDPSGVTPTVLTQAIAARDAALAAVASVAYSTWQATTAYSTGQTVQAPDGSLIKRTTGGTSRSTFDATEQALWTVVSGTTGTLEKVGLDKTYLPGVSVKAYGAVGNGSTDDSAAFAAAHAALPANGGTIFLPPGAYKLASTVAFTKPVRLIGSGGRLIGDGGLSPIRAATTIVFNTTTGNCLTFSGLGSSLSDLAVVNDSSTTPTAGTGILLSTGSQAAFDRVTVVGFWNNIEIDDAVYWSINSCHVYDPVNYGIYVNSTGANYTDHQDAGIFNSFISMFYKSYSAQAGIRWRQGAGFRIIGNKINGALQPGNSAGTFAVGIDVYADETRPVGDIQIIGNSIANFTTAGVRCYSTGGTAQVNWVNIHSNQINVGLGSTSWGVLVTADSTANHSRMKQISIANNNFESLSGGSINVGFGEQISVGPNFHSNVTGTILLVGDGLALHSEMFGYSIARQHCGDFSKVLVSDWRSQPNNRFTADGHTEHVYDMPFHTETGFLTHTLWTVEPTPNGAVELDLYLTLNGALGQYIVHKKLGVLRSGTGTASQASPTGWTDITRVNGTASVATDLTFNFDTATTAGSLIIKVTATSGASTIDGHARLEMRGQVRTVTKGADRGP